MARLDGGRFLGWLYHKDSLLASLLDRIIVGVNTLSEATGVSAAGEHAAPSPVNAITLKAHGELLHATLSHAAMVKRPIRYFLEADTSPSFTQPHVMDLGASRTHIFTLPSQDDNGVPHKWYFRAYAQYPGSKPSIPVVLGGAGNPTTITLTGATRMSLLPSTGSGTASPTGQQGAQGMGKQSHSSPKVIRLGRPQASQAAVAPPSVTSHLLLNAVVNTASGSISLTQSGTTTTINVSAGTFQLGPIKLSTTAGSVDPGSYGTWYVYHDDPQLQGGNVTFVATSDPSILNQGLGRFYDGKITTAAGGGGSGGGSFGGCFTADVRVKVPSGLLCFGEMSELIEIVNLTGRHKAALVVHIHNDELMLKLPGMTGLTTESHLFQRHPGEDIWVPARDKGFVPAAMPARTVYNLHVLSNHPRDQHYVLENGEVAHNLKPLG